MIQQVVGTSIQVELQYTHTASISEEGMLSDGILTVFMHTGMRLRTRTTKTAQRLRPMRAYMRNAENAVTP